MINASVVVIPHETNEAILAEVENNVHAYSKVFSTISFNKIIFAKNTLSAMFTTSGSVEIFSRGFFIPSL